MKWRDLKEQGIHRCWIVFVNGKRCKRRSAVDGGMKHGVCEKHAHVERTINRIAKAGFDADLATHATALRNHEREENG